MKSKALINQHVLMHFLNQILHLLRSLNKTEQTLTKNSWIFINTVTHVLFINASSNKLSNVTVKCYWGVWSNKTRARWKKTGQCLVIIQQNEIYNQFLEGRSFLSKKTVAGHKMTIWCSWTSIKLSSSSRRSIIYTREKQISSRNNQT